MSKETAEAFSRLKTGVYSVVGNLGYTLFRYILFLSTFLRLSL